MLKVKGDKVEIGQDAVRCLSIVDYVWDLKNFTELKKNESISSPIFHGKKCTEKWALQAKLSEKEDGDVEEHVEIGLYLVDSSSAQAVKAEFQFNILNAENQVVIAGQPRTNEFLMSTGFVIAPKYKTLNLPSGLIDGNILRINCQVSTKTLLNLKQKQDDEEHSVKKQFKSFFTNGDFADMILKTETTSFPASKLILAAHSPVFSAMFSSGMLESAENVVKIEDFTDEAVRGFLEFMYIGETRVLEENPMDLLKISDKYQVMELKKKAEHLLLGKLRIESAVKILILAHFHSPTTLKPNVITFVNKNSKEILQTAEFKEMTGKFPELVLDLYTQVLSAEEQDKS